MWTANHRVPASARLFQWRLPLGLAALALLSLCLSWVLPHHHGFEDDSDCGLCQLIHTPGDLIATPFDGATIIRDLPHEKPVTADSPVPEGPALLDLRPRGPPPV
jgi:hypothetical protein